MLYHDECLGNLCVWLGQWYLFGQMLFEILVALSF